MPSQRSSSGAAGPGGAASESGSVRSVERALEILNLLSEDRPRVTIREIVEETGLAKTTVIRIAHTLVQNGLLWSTDTGFMAGPGLWRWAHLAHHAWELPAQMQQMMQDLAKEQQETVNLYIRRDIHRICIAQAESPRALRHVVRIGDELPLWGGASSKALLLDADDALVKRVAASAPRGVEHLDADELRAAIEVVRAEGFAASHGERESGVSAVAVPLLDDAGSVFAALSVSGSTPRFSEERVIEIVPALRSLADGMAGRGLGAAFGRAR
ncbi:IclR family transcriptional regulator [Mumia sp. Pv 4-285]|uniref:IclR family transcriptional regulator n=1 Tax=Mumia qirimensis TaxID=3234852 RepID=UPI00351D52C9